MQFPSLSFTHSAPLFAHTTSTSLPVWTFSKIFALSKSPCFFHFISCSQVAWAVGDIQQTRGGTNTGSAIDMMRNEFFSPGHARDQVVKIGIVITDGRYDCK